MKSFYLETDGKGQWSKSKKKVKITKIKHGLWSGNEICLFFSNWNVENDGLIYTDRTFIRQFRKYLVSKGMPKKVANDIDYTEQGMQGNKYVSLGYGEVLQSYLVHKIMGE